MKVIYLPNVKDFILSLEPVLRKKASIVIDSLQEYGHLLKLPLSKSLGKGLFELRVLGAEQTRVLYCFHKSSAYLLHAIKKKSQKIPGQDIEIARRMKKLVESL